MKENKMKKIFGFISGGIVGGLVGSALALLLTPSSGDVLRNQLQSRISHFQAELKEAAASRRVDLEKQLAALRSPRQPE
jgi:gas vesicle protein